MNRGEIWSVSGAPGYGSKPRPALIVQSDTLTTIQSVIICGITSVEVGDVPFRCLFHPTSDNGLNVPSSVMADKLIAVPRHRLGERIGKLSGEDMTRVEQAMLLVLGFAG